MKYEHQAEVNKVAAAFHRIFAMVTDEVPDKEQVAQIMLEASGAVLSALAAVGAENKEAYKAKFFAKVGLRIADSALDSQLPDSQS